MLHRRELLALLGIAGGAAAASSLPALRAIAQSRREVLVIGIDISDSTSLDPPRDQFFTTPMTIAACYETLVTMSPGDYITLKPALATKWERIPDGKGWRFTLRDNVKFVSGNPLTAHDVKFSLDRLRFLGYQASQYIANVEAVNVIDDRTVDVVLKNPADPILTILASPQFVVTDRAEVEKRGGIAAAGAREKDTATEWLNQNSAGSGPYKLVGWLHNSHIQLVANPDYWGGKPPFQRVVIRHIEDGAAQLLALRRGDIDVAFNLLPEQVASLKDEKAATVESIASLDLVYMGLTHNPEFNKALAHKKARQAIAFAIDYEGIKNGLLGGAAMRPASFIPVGCLGSTQDVAREIGFREDLERSKKLLAEAGYPDGFEFEITHPTSVVAGTSFSVLGQKIQSDLSRVGIKAKVVPVPRVNMVTLYNSGKTTAVITSWNPPAVENALWSWATVQRVAKRLHWTPPVELVNLVDRAAAEADPKTQEALYLEYQRAMVEEANLIVLFQPIYRVGIRKTISQFPLTAAGWRVDMRDAKAS